MRVNRIATAAAALAAILSASLPARATIYTWTGGNGLSNSWYSASNWAGDTVPRDEPPGDYVFAASGWNAAQTTIAIDGANRQPDAEMLTFNGNANVPLTIQIGSGNSLWLSPATSGATTITVPQTGVAYTIAGSSGATIQLGDDQQWSVAGVLNISAVIWDEGESPAPGFVKTGAGTLILSGNNSFVGPITINQGAISVSTIAGKGQACNLGRGDLTLNGGVLNYTGTAPSVSTSRGFTLGAAGGAIDVQNAAASLTFTGAVTGGQAGLTKTGSGTLTLAGTNTYTGLTTVTAGVLDLVDRSSGWTGAFRPILSGGSASVQGGKLIFDYTGGSDPLSAIQPLLNTPRLYGASGTPPLIALDNTTTCQVTVESTLYGDADLNGTVNGADLDTVLSNFNKTGMGWSQGDFDYNGTVNGADLNTVLSNFNQHVSVGAAVPEPSTLLLAAAGSLGLLAYAWRKQK
jgi:autotransporter-associated beta strand protein